MTAPTLPALPTPVPPSQRLLGVDLPNGWKVVAPFEGASNATGSCFSTGYVVEKDGKRGFMKALDYFTPLLHAPDPAQALNALTSAYLFERDVLLHCNGRRLSRVVAAIDHGSVNVEPGLPGGVVQYLIFELASGDVRMELEFSGDVDDAWKLRTLHQIAVGLQQLHGQEIAHQDVKPSNVLMFRTPKANSAISDEQQCEAGRHRTTI